MISQVVFILGFVLTILIGVVLGLIGGGGSILTVPLVHYCFGISFMQATTYSLFIVGVAASVGFIRRIKSKDFSLRDAIVFVIPSASVAFVIRAFVLPILPESYVIASKVISSEQIISVFLVLLMVYTSINILFKKTVENENSTSILKIIVFGSITGCLAGVLGAGGGFIIVPVLMKMGLSIRKAVGTSMIIVAIQSLVALVGDISNFNGSITESIDIPLLVLLTLSTVVGVFIGTYLQSFFSGKILRKLFSYLLLLVSILIIVDRFFF